MGCGVPWRAAFLSPRGRHFMWVSTRVFRGTVAGMAPVEDGGPSHKLSLILSSWLPPSVEPLRTERCPGPFIPVLVQDISSQGPWALPHGEGRPTLAKALHVFVRRGPSSSFGPTRKPWKDQSSGRKGAGGCAIQSQRGDFSKNVRRMGRFPPFHSSLESTVHAGCLRGG